MTPPVVPKKQPEPPPARDGPFVLGASFTPRWNSDPSYDFFAEDDVTVAYGLWLGYDLFHLGPRFALAAELGWSTEHEEQFGLAGGTLDTELRTCAWELSGDLRWEALPVLWPHVRLGGGFAKSKLQLNSYTDGDFEDVDFSGTLVAGLGATLKTPPGTFSLRTLSLGLRVELGYRVMAPTDANLEPEDAADGDAIPVVRPSLGEVSRSGPYIGVSLVGRI
jgi:hypothetical protein